MKALVRLFALALLAGLLIDGAKTALAHARLLRSDPSFGAVLPAPPPVAQLWFSERIEPELISATLYDAAGGALPSSSAPHLSPGDRRQVVVPLPALGDGTYTLVWRVVSAEDGHATTGSLPFRVGQGAAPVNAPPGTPAPEPEGPGLLSVVVRWLQLVGLLALVGGAAAGLLVLRPALRAVGEDALIPLLRGWRWMLRLAGALLLPALLAALLVQAQAVSGKGLAEALQLDVLGPLLLSRWGALWVGRVGCVVLLVPLLLPGGAGLRAWPLALALLAGCLTLLTYSMISHAAVGAGAMTAILLDWVHLLAAALWAGGLLSLALVLLQARRVMPEPPGSLTLDLVGSFSRLALGAVALLILTGIYGSLRHIPTAQDLWGSSYGRALLLKLALVAAALLVGLYHWLLARPQLARALGKQGPERRLLARLRGSVGLESGLAALVLLGASMLVQTPPPVDLSSSANQIVVPADLFAPPAPFHESKASGDLTIALDLDAQTWGQRAYTVTLQTSAAQPADADRVRLRIRASDMEMGLANVDLERREPGLFTSRSSAISMAGVWQIEVTVRRRGREDVRAIFTVTAR